MVHDIRKYTYEDLTTKVRTPTNCEHLKDAQRLVEVIERLEST